MNSQLRLAAAAIAVAGAALAGCASSGTTAASAPSTPSASSSAHSPSSPAPGSSLPPLTPSASASGTPAPSSGAGSTAECSAAQLKIAYTSNRQIRNGALAGMSHADNVVTFTNEGSASCQTGGFPGVAALDSAGRQVKQAVRSPGAGRLLVLAPGQTASTMLSANTAACARVTTVAGLLVTAPNQRTSTRLGPAGQFCLRSLQVDTLVRGNSAGLKL